MTRQPNFAQTLLVEPLVMAFTVVIGLLVSPIEGCRRFAVLRASRMDECRIVSEYDLQRRLWKARGRQFVRGFDDLLDTIARLHEEFVTAGWQSDREAALGLAAMRATLEAMVEAYVGSVSSSPTREAGTPNGSPYRSDSRVTSSGGPRL